MALECLHLLISILMQILPFVHNLVIFFFSEIVIIFFYDQLVIRLRVIRFQSVIILVINISHSRSSVVRFCYRSSGLHSVLLHFQSKSFYCDQIKFNEPVLKLGIPLTLNGFQQNDKLVVICRRLY